MDSALHKTLIKLRFLVGFLGEKSQHGWWQSSFLSPELEAFLGPIFPRTKWLAAYHGVVEAAARVHDERIGVGSGVYHLFRLPRSLEQVLHELMMNHEVTADLIPDLSDRSSAETSLNGLAMNEVKGSPGPISFGTSDDVGSVGLWRRAAACYLEAFSDGSQSFPYVTGAR